MRIPHPSIALRQARLQLQEHGVCPDTIDTRIARSWQRSLAAGLLPCGRLNDTEHLNGDKLSRALAANHDLLAHSRPVMEFLFGQIKHTHSMLVLADHNGLLMHTLGDLDILSKAERVALTTGASWHEQHRGTNAIGTALAERGSIEIHGAEHFHERNGFLTCAATPIMSTDGNLLGVIDISGDQRGRHPHTLGLASMAAQMIEHRMVIASCRSHIRLHLHKYSEGIGSVAEGILALSEDGWIVGANRNALALLHLAPADLSTTPLVSALNICLDELRKHQKHYPGQATPVHLHDGTPLFALLYSAAAPLVATQSAHATAAPSDALAKLDTGDARWRNCIAQVRRVLDKPIPLLLQGESGVGKEFFARALHDSSARHNRAFVAINCAAIPENLIEAELFGYAPGAFTGARREGNPGRLREAHGGTLFLDEIGDMPLPLQSRLLRVLQERQVLPIGGSRAVDVDFALICATHHTLRERAEQGYFRSDLYYRINGYTVNIPALRERTDFATLTENILATLNPEGGIRIAPDLLAQLGRHIWPGNLRQYANVLRTASAMLDSHEDTINESHLPDDLVAELSAPTGHAATQKSPDAAQNLKALSLAAIKQTLADSQGNISEAARRLEISRQTLYRKLK